MRIWCEHMVAVLSSRWLQAQASCVAVTRWREMLRPTCSQTDRMTPARTRAQASKQACTHPQSGQTVAPWPGAPPGVLDLALRCAWDRCSRGPAAGACMPMMDPCFLCIIVQPVIWYSSLRRKRTRQGCFQSRQNKTLQEQSTYIP